LRLLLAFLSFLLAFGWQQRMSSLARCDSSVAGWRSAGFATLLVAILVGCLLDALGYSPNVGVWAVFFAGSAAFLLVGDAGLRDLLHPVRVFGSLWCFCLGFGSMHLLFGSQWSARMWECVLTPLTIFPLGFWVGRHFCSPRTVGFLGTHAREHASSPFAWRRALWVAAISLLVGASALAYEYHLIGGVPVLSDNPDVARMELFGVAGQQDSRFDTAVVKLVHPFVDFTKYAAFLALLVLVQTKSLTRGAKLTCLLIVALGILAFASQGGRGFFVQAVIVGVALVHYLHRRIKIWEFSVAAVLLFFFVAAYGSFRIQESGSAPLFEDALEASRLPVGVLWDGVAFGYSTATISFEVFDHLIDDLRYVGRPPKGFLMYSLHRFVPRSNIQEFAFDLYGGEAVTPTFLGEFYGDYGYWGVLFGPLLLGIAYGWVYTRSFAEPGFYWVYVRSLFLELLVFFPYVDLFSQYLTWIFDLFFMYWLLRWAFPAAGRSSGRVAELLSSGAALARGTGL
jgi:oligosaccharide repeat unit polymerase